MEIPKRAPSWIVNFRCIAERCEDTCCAGLKVPVSQERLRRMHETLGEGPETELLRASVLPNPGGSPAEHVFLRERADGRCPFLDTERLCSLHRRYGDAVLPDACATFPRIVWQQGEQWEVAASLACPEMTRLVLLGEGDLEWVPAPADLMPRPGMARPYPGVPGDIYALHAERIRSAALRLLHRREFPLSSRLALLGQMAFRLDSVFRGAEPFPGGEAQAGELLEALLQPFDTPDALEAMHRDFCALEVPGGPCAGLFASVLKARSAAAYGERFEKLVRGVLASLWGTEEGAGEPDTAWQVYAARRERLEALHGARVQQYFLRHGVNHWLRTPFTDAPSLLRYVFQLVMRVALLRLTLVGHPAVAALCAEPEATPSPEDAQAVLDRAAVESFQNIAKHVEQAPDFLSLAQGLAGAGGAETLGKTLVFAKFC